MTIKSEQDDVIDGLDDLSTTYAAEKESLQAPEHLEFMVKRMAREAQSDKEDKKVSIEAKKKSAGNSSKPKWFLSVAAAVVIAVTLTLIYQTDLIEQDSDEPQLAISEQVLEKQIQVTAETEFELADLTPDLDVTTTKEESTEDEVVSETETQTTANNENKFQFGSPSDVDALIQPTNKTIRVYPKDEILKSWSDEQWRKVITQHRLEGDEVSVRYYLDHYLALRGQVLKFP